MNILSPGFWVNALVSTMITMICIYLIKKANEKFNLPVVSEIVETV